MPRKYRRVTDRSFPAENMKNATEDVLLGRLSVRQSAIQHNVRKSTLAVYVKKSRESGIENVKFSPQYVTTQVFSDELESAMANYLRNCSNMYHGLTPKSTRRLAYEFAKKNKVKTPPAWEKNHQAGRDWFTGFLSRQPNLSLRTPEATSLARISSFNPTTVGDFQNKLESVLKRHQFLASDIYNLDETGVTTVQKVQKIIATKGQHQVGQVTSRERGELVTQVGIIAANGTTLPPVWIFPRKKYDPHRMLKNVPAEYGAISLVHQSGWMTSDNFLKVLEHFVKHVRCSAEHNVVLIMDNHESHLSVAGIDYCKENGIIILTLPPHTSDHLQPLDKAVFGPFKRFFNQGADEWMLSHPGQTLSIYDLPAICCKAWDRGATPSNIKSGFRCTGIWPFDKNIFTEQDFLCSYVTDRPVSTSEPEKSASNDIPVTNLSPKAASSEEVEAEALLYPKAGPSTAPDDESYVSPSKILPYPKAPQRKSPTVANRGPFRKKSIIATDTPERDNIAKKKMKITKPKIDKNKVKQVKKKVFVESSSSSDEELSYQDSSSELEPEIEEESENTENLEVGHFLICKVYGKKSVRQFVARVEEVVFGGYNVKFLKKQLASNRFKYSEEPTSFVPFNDIVVQLPNPIADRSSRYKDMIYFNRDLTEYSLF